MANRTQKAAMKMKADSAKADKAKAKREEELDFEAARARQMLDAGSRKGGKAKGKDKKAAAKEPEPALAKAPKPVKGKPKGKGKAEAAKTVQGEHAIEFKDETPGFWERWRAKREEKAQLRQVEADRRAAEKAAEKERKAKERAEAEEKARKEAEERAAAEAAAAAAAEKERKRLEKREAAKEAKRQAEMAEAIKEAEAQARKEERRLQRQAERAAIEERERRAAEEAEAADRRREAEREAERQADLEAAARKAARAAEIEPDLEFEEPSEPVDPKRALVPAPKGKDKGKKDKAADKAGRVHEAAKEPAAPATPADAQADKVAQELARMRSKPVVIVEEDETPAPRLPDLKSKPKEDDAEEPVPLVTGEAVVDEKYRPETPMPAPPSGLSIPEMFFLVATDHGWDERAEKAKDGRLGGAFAGAIFLELLQRGRLVVQRDRFTVVGEPGDDAAVEAAVAKVRSIREKKGDLSSLPHMRRVAKWNRELLEPFKDQLAERGLIRHGHRMHLGLFYRSSVEVLDEDAQERLRNKLRRTIAGGGTPEAASVLMLGLLDACGLLGTIVPDEAMDYNRKRLNGLLAGRDIMGYKVDPALKALQEVAIRTILQNVRTMTYG